MKQFKLFWSYRISSTERWLERMAYKGYILKDINRFTRIFTFDKTVPPNKVTFSIQYNSGALSESLKSDGWQEHSTTGKWGILKNEDIIVSFYPSRESLFKRIRLHAYLFLMLSIFYLSTGPINLLIFETINTNDPNYAALIITVLVFLALAGLSTFVFISYRTFEKKTFNLKDEIKYDRKKIRKIRLAWMYQPLQTKIWLDEMHHKGYELESVFATIFSFVPSRHEKIAYEVTFEPKLKSDYYIIHKEIGWKLKYTSNMSLLNYSIWAMPYDEANNKPAFSYDVSEKRLQIKKAFRMNMTIAIFLLFVLAQSMYMQWVLDTDSSTINTVLKYLLTCMTIFWILLSVKIITGYRKEKNLLKES